MKEEAEQRKVLKNVFRRVWRTTIEVERKTNEIPNKACKTTIKINEKK